jgi:hypothetical protein
MRIVAGVFSGLYIIRELWRVLRRDGRQLFNRPAEI